MHAVLRMHGRVGPYIIKIEKKWLSNHIKHGPRQQRPLPEGDS